MNADTASTIALNVVAPTRLARAVLPAFLERDAGAIINVASVMAFHALPITTLYSATKSFVLMFSRGLQGELAETGVRVQAVLPAGTATEFFDQSGIPLSALDPAAVMTTENLVDAALAGFDAGEAVTLPSIHDVALWTAYNEARDALFGATQVGSPASRYAQAM
jgi:short-subunit dehydrogenase